MLKPTANLNSMETFLAIQYEGAYFGKTKSV